MIPEGQESSVHPRRLRLVPEIGARSIFGLRLQYRMFANLTFHLESQMLRNIVTNSMVNMHVTFNGENYK